MKIKWDCQTPFDQTEAECFRILHMTDEEVRAELRAQGKDPAKIAADMRHTIAEAINRYRALRKWNS